MEEAKKKDSILAIAHKYTGAMVCSCGTEMTLKERILWESQKIGEHSEMQRKLNGRWIPASERLPEDGQEVLVITQRGKAVQFVRYNKAYNMFDIIGGLGSVGKYGVTHWMPLPEPPKEV